MQIGEYTYKAFSKNKFKDNADEYRIICLGESTTAPVPNSYPEQLQKILNKKQSTIIYKVLNFGEIDSNTTKIINLRESKIEEYKPNMIITMMGINDWSCTEQSQDPEEEITYGSSNLKILKLFAYIKMHIKVRIEKILLERKTAKDKDQDTDTPKKYENLPKDSFLGEKDLNESLSPDKDGPYNENIETGLQHKKKGEFHKAEECFINAIKIDPENYLGYFLLGFLYKDDLQDVEKAIPPLKKSTLLAPIGHKRQMPVSVLVDIYNERQDYDSSLKLLTKIIKREQYSILAYFELAYCYFAKKEYEYILSLVEKTLKKTPLNHWPHSILYVGYTLAGDKQNAKDNYIKYTDYLMNNINPFPQKNYQNLKKIVDKHDITLIVMQYPLLSEKPLRKILGKSDDIIFIENVLNFEKVLKDNSYDELFQDMFGETFGHCTAKGYNLIAENATEHILRFKDQKNKIVKYLQ